MLVTVFGASGAIGEHIVAAALEDGHEVRAVTRSPRGDDGGRLHVTWVQGDLEDVVSIPSAIEGSDAVVWAVGATRNTADQVPLFENATRALIAAMDELGVPRLVALSGAGIAVDRERKPLGGRLMSAFVGLAARHVVAAKQVEYDLIKQSRLDWVLVRPPRVVPGAATGRYAAGDELKGSRVTQGDLAEFMVAQLTDSTYLRRAPFVASL